MSALCHDTVTALCHDTCRCVMNLRNGGTSQSTCLVRIPSHNTV
jgi:hypothetical protein